MLADTAMSRPGITYIAHDLIFPSELNPRQDFDAEGLEELAASIREYGIIEPLVVRRRRPIGLALNHDYELVAGERRWRAAKIAGLTSVPCMIRDDVDDKAAVEMMLVENLQRAGLNAIETALGYRRLVDLGVKQAEIGRRVGRSQPLVANTMRLLQLPADVQERIRKGELTTAHGVALAQYQHFPAVASKLAEIAVERKVTSKDLAEWIPYSWDLERAGVLKTVESRSGFIETTCKHCPFGAYRSNNSYSGVCLKPEHYRELKAVELAEANAKARAELAAAREAAGQTALADDESVVNGDKMGYDSVEELSDYRGPHGKAPPGCKLTECPSYTRGIRYNRATILCLDPKCFKRLATAQTKAENKARKLSIQQRAKALALATKPLTEIGPREAAIVAAYALSQADRDAIAPALSARGIPESAHRKPYSASESKALLDEYAKLDPHTLLLAVVEALVQGEASRDLDNRSTYGEANLQAGAWYVEPAPEPAIEVEASEAVEVPRL